MLNRSFAHIDIQRRALDASWLRQSVLSNNIANVNTPGYKRRDVDFDALLSDYIDGRSTTMTRTHSRHFNTGGDLGALSPVVQTSRNTSYRLDGNNVNIDVEMAQQAANSIKYNAMTKQVNSQFSRLKSAIRGE